MFLGEFKQNVPKIFKGRLQRVAEGCTSLQGRYEGVPGKGVLQACFRASQGNYWGFRNVPKVSGAVFKRVPEANPGCAGIFKNLKDIP